MAMNLWVPAVLQNLLLGAQTEALQALYALARREELGALEALCRIDALTGDLLEAAKSGGLYCQPVD